jgi:hypothetical protein
MDATPRTTPRKSATFDDYSLSEIRRAAASGIYDIRGAGAKRKVPHFDDLLFLGASISRYPLEGYREKCATDVWLGTRFAEKPIHLKIPITIAGMSFGSLSAQAKEALGRGANVVRQTQVTLSAKAYIPLACSPIADCAAIAIGAKSQLGFDEATCVASDGGAGCDCEIEDTIVEQTSDTYTKSGSTITSGGGDTYDYCVAGSKLTYTQTNAEFPVFLELGK